MRDKETAVEMGLKEMLQEAVDALMLHCGYQQRAINACVVAGLTDPSDERKKLGAIKAALAYFERLAAVEVEVTRTISWDNGVQVTQDVYTATDITKIPQSCAIDCYESEPGTWRGSAGYLSYRQLDLKGFAHLAAALECRKRNGEVG